jgi:hypothetical protein
VIRILAILTLCTLSLPASATEILINYPAKAALVRMATALGYYDATAKSIVAQARVDAGGDYFFNNVGQFVATPAVIDPVTRVETSPAIMAPGLWARLRHNADPASLAAKIAQSATAAAALGILIYRRLPLGPKDIAGNPTLCWSADNSTCGPSYLDLIGVIA